MNTAHRNPFILLLLLLCVAISVAYNNTTNCKHRCGSGDCIQLDQLCDGRAQCLDASDETVEMCGQVWCPGYSFRCSYGACVASTAVCDGQHDCVDGSDEEGWLCRAQMQQANCDNWEMYCQSGQCVPYSGLCDGKKDCLDGDDELDTLCEGATKASSTINSSTTTDNYIVLMGSTTSMRNLTAPRQEDDECVVPQIANLIIKHSSNAVLRAGTKVPNDTRIHYDCPADHSLKGEHENICSAPMWLHQFPYCETPTSPVFSLVIAMFSFLIVVLLVLIYKVRRDDRHRPREELIWLVENTNNPPKPSDIAKV
ncbi:sortilin-related receptor [Drosophila obscura]|uniref:sortilin-related receptor n=1 Tax=Drosophila obscura TaxID=7282 RepID=UPI001BB1615C|nr:sortilin-related receptor [Drosophila obscura]